MRCVLITPFGMPVEPEVNRNFAMVSGVTFACATSAELLEVCAQYLGAADAPEHDIRRWRDVPMDSSGSYIVVSIPFFELQVIEHGREALRMPVVVGQTTWQTPMFSDELEYIIVNPDWGIPETIAKVETWPLAKRDPGYLRREGIVASGTSLRQKPGPNNPLGRIKFVMPNEHDVYLHDTPHKRAFDAAVRTAQDVVTALAKRQTA